jgi:hypothetical protein
MGTDMVRLNNTGVNVSSNRNSEKKEEVKMKKIVMLVIALMMVASVSFAQNITSATLKDLKGTWTGWATFQIGVNSPCTLVILNDTVPVKGIVTLETLPDSVSPLMGQLAAPGGKYTFSNDDGKVTSQGTLMWAGNKNFVEFSLKRNKLDGWFYHNGARGDIVLHKK